MKPTHSTAVALRTPSNHLPIKGLFLTAILIAALGAIGSNCATAPEDLAGAVAYKEVVGVSQGEEIPLLTETTDGAVKTDARCVDFEPNGGRLTVDDSLEAGLHEQFAALGYRIGVRLEGGGETEIHYVSRESFNALEVGTSIILDAARMTLADGSAGTHQILF